MAERVEVLRDGRLDTPLTESWDQLIEEIIPAGLSGLFFFDGEKIEAFADVENSAQLISKALHALLGLDLVDRLSDDLIMLANRQQASIKSELERIQLDHAETEIAQLEESKTEMVELRGSRQNELDRLEKRLKDCELRYELEGGLLAD
jgi:DNA sulfur modification protein DndD